MSIRFKDKNEGTPTKEEMKLHIIENLIEKRYCNYSNGAPLRKYTMRL